MSFLSANIENTLFNQPELGYVKRRFVEHNLNTTIRVGVTRFVDEGVDRIELIYVDKHQKTIPFMRTLPSVDTTDTLNFRGVWRKELAILVEEAIDKLLLLGEANSDVELEHYRMGSTGNFRWFNNDG